MPFNATDVEYVLNRARVLLPGSSDSGIKLAMWSVLKEFLKDSNAWLETQRLLVTAGTQQYVIAPREGGQVIRLLGVLDGNLVPVQASMSKLGVLDISTPVQVSSVPIPVGQTGTAANYPWYVGIVKNIDFPATKDAIPIAPDFILKVYAEVIVDGVVGNMMMEQAKAYTNPALGKYHLAKFRDGISIARNEVRMQNIFGAQRWQFPPFGGGSQRGGNAIWPSEGRF